MIRLFLANRESFIESAQRLYHLLGASRDPLLVGGKEVFWLTFTSPHRTSYHNPKKYVCFEYITFFISEKTSDEINKNEKNSEKLKMIV